MKKIIDLIEKYFELDDNAPAKEAVEARKECAETIWHIGQEIGNRVARRRELESTPITEDWLKEHGWICDSDDWWHHPSRALIIFTRFNTWGVYDTDMNLRSLADLYDALELCGITMD